MKGNAVERSEYIEKEYKKYLRSSFKMKTSKLQREFEDKLKNTVLFKGPYVELTLPFKQGNNLKGLIEEGIVAESFKDLAGIDLERPLYMHQERAIKQIHEGRGAIITTGTGSGKTECFLYPIFNEILREIESGNNSIGIRAIFLYPLNALINDQIERIEKILSGYTKITYGFFTGDTDEKEREKIRKNPPHLLFTNYSMLEYLLIRPHDYTLFEPSKLKNWKFVVMDEAHTYYGALGIELSFLMRRLTGLAERKPRFILTSATLGEEKKSEKEIVSFAESLTSAKFIEKDIIFSERISFSEDIGKFSVIGEDYKKLKVNIENIDSVKGIVNKYYDGKCYSIEEYLYELLIRDRNVFKLYKNLHRESKNFKEILSCFEELSKDDLLNLIDLVNYAEKNGKKIFDLKYHSFVRPLVGAYINLAEPHELSLIPTNRINDFKAFEIGNCKYCNHTFIIGKKIKKSNNLEYLVQNTEIDIYENYGDNKYLEINYFLLDNQIDEEFLEESEDNNKNKNDNEKLRKYKLCRKCGCIAEDRNINKKYCDCGSEHLVIVYEVIRNKKNKVDESKFNNITTCPCCGHRSHNGIVKSFNIGKDEGTAIIAQILYEVIDSKEKIVEAKKNSLFNPTKKGKKIIKEVKQCIVFSDSRQQASFFAAFLDRNHNRLLGKRLIWEIVKDNDFKEIPLEDLVNQLKNKITDNKLFDNNLTDKDNAWLIVLKELLKVDGSYDGEGLGLYYFDINLDGLLPENVGIDDIKTFFQEKNIELNIINTKEEFFTLAQILFKTFKVVPAIQHIRESALSKEQLKELEYRGNSKKIILEKGNLKEKDGNTSFLPRSKSNYNIRYLQKVFGYNIEEAKRFLREFFEVFIQEDKIFEENRDGYQIKATAYILKNYINSGKYYICKKCFRLTPYNINNMCVQDKCDGKLEIVDPDNILKDNYYRYKYKEKEIEGLIVKEHTAQLSKAEGKEYQEDFKAKKINILSCSTTFEMGIDIGTLETVFMRNIPPFPANYVQRAGRAGRRKESIAYILTYCSNSSHDYTYFEYPEKMISGKINPPKFKSLNRKIIIRHLMAICLGYYFRVKQLDMKKVDIILEENFLKNFRNFILNDSLELKEYIEKKVLPEDIFLEYRDFNWFKDLMDKKSDKLKMLIDSLNNDIAEFEIAKELALKKHDYKKLSSYDTEINKIKNKGTIDTLSKFCVIPKYGFPVDIVNLDIYDSGTKGDKYDLDRDLKIAIAEYAPDSEIYVNKEKWISKYITLPKTDEFSKYYDCQCDRCKKWNIFLTIYNNKCKNCGNKINVKENNFFIEPILGFKAIKKEKDSTMKPKRSYTGDVVYIGGGLINKNCLEFSNNITIETSIDDELLIKNKFEFYMCKKCGYSEIRKKNSILSNIDSEHNDFRRCKCTEKKLYRTKLGHIFRTDVAKIHIPFLYLGGIEEEVIARSLMYALLEGISNALEIERRDIDGILDLNLDTETYEILIYDNVAGGAGHVKRLCDHNALLKSLKAALTKVSQECCDEDTSCYNCLRNYNNQAYHEKIKRGKAKDILKKILKGSNLKL